MKTATATSRRNATAIAWFKLGAEAFARTLPAALADLGPDAPPLYVCPICWHGFAEGALAPGYLTLEHVPPKAAGGKPLVLTCRACNNRAGEGVDAEMSKAERGRAFLQGELKKPHRVKLALGELKINADAVVGPGGFQFFGLPRQNDPKVHAAFFEEVGRISKAGSSWQFTIGLPHERYAAHQARVSWLRAAYLAAFARFGYRYALNPNLAIVRRQLADPKTEIIPVFKIQIPGVGRTERKFVLIREPSDLACLGVQMGRHLVFLPHNGQAGFYDRLEAHRKTTTGKRAEFSGQQFAWPKGPVHEFDFAERKVPS
jgi:hypothetical protein